MVAGDQTCLDIKVDRGASCFLSTQASTKIYRNPDGLPCSHELTASIAEGALFVLAPDPVQCFAGSCYEQRQRFELASNASLVLVDWMSSGRCARGERWRFVRYHSRNELWRDGEMLLLDNLLLDLSDAAPGGLFRTGGFDCLATVAIIGQHLAVHAHAILSWINEQPITPKASLVLAASPLREGLLLRLAGKSVEQVGREIHRHLAFVDSLLADDPWRRKW
jgi:urease accessory protein